MSTDEDRIKEAIGYEPIVISIDGHPNIGQTYRTVNDRDDLVRRLLPVLAAVRAETQATILQAIDDVTPAGKPDRDALDRALGEVLWNASNYPVPSAVLGRDISTLRKKCVDAVMAEIENDGCWLKTGDIPGDEYCGKHGRDAGWPCEAE